MPYLDSTLRRLIDQHLNRTDKKAQEFAREIGVTPQTFSKWRSGKQPVSDLNWLRIHDALGIEAEDAPTGVRIVSPVPSSAMAQVPVLGAAAAAGFEPAVEPLDDFLTGFGGDMDSWPADLVDNGSFCLRVEGNSMSPEFPDGTILLVAGGHLPKRGDLVVARLADQGEVVVKRYDRRNGIVMLESENPEGQSFTIDLKAEPGRLIWMWPVKQARIDLERRRWARRKFGVQS